MSTYILGETISKTSTIHPYHFGKQHGTKVIFKTYSAIYTFGILIHFILYN